MSKIVNSSLEKSGEVILWLDDVKFRILNASFLHHLNSKFSNNKFTKSLKGSLIGPVKRRVDNNFILKGEFHVNK